MALSRTAKTRLTKLIEFMEKLPPAADQHFHMDAYVAHGGDHTHKVPRIPTQKDLLTCGTTACAAGWAASVPSFQKAGFRLGITRDWGSPRIVPRFRRFRDGTALCKFFAITNWQMFELFSAGLRVKTPKEWADRARKHVDKWSAA